MTTNNNNFKFELKMVKCRKSADDIYCYELSICGTSVKHKIIKRLSKLFRNAHPFLIEERLVYKFKKNKIFCYLDEEIYANENRLVLRVHKIKIKDVVKNLKNTIEALYKWYDLLDKTRVRLMPDEKFVFTIKDGKIHQER